MISKRGSKEYKSGALAKFQHQVKMTKIFLLVALAFFLVASASAAEGLAIENWNTYTTEELEVVTTEETYTTTEQPLVTTEESVTTEEALSTTEEPTLTTVELKPLN